MRVDSLPESEIVMSLPPFCEDVAKTIGGQISPQRIAAVIELSNQRSCIAHGIKRSYAIGMVAKEGVKPLTPEGGQVSFWTSGSRIFRSSLGNTPLGYYDTTFFQYAHSRDDRSQERTMAIALTNRLVLERLGLHVKIPSNSTVTIHAIVPPEALHLLIVKQKLDSTQPLQPVMFDLLEDVLRQGLFLSSTTIVNL